MQDYERWNRLFGYLRSNDPELDLYVYRLNFRGRRQRPYLWRTFPHDGVLETLRDHHGGGEFYIMIRDGSTMVLSGAFAVATPRKIR